MRAPRSWGRSSAFLTLLLHLLAVAAGPVVDARLEAPLADAHVGIHFESEDAPPCSSGHRHAFCAVCRVLQSLDAPTGGAPVLVAVVLPSRGLGAPARGIPPAFPSFSPLGPRAPPAA